MGKYEVFSETTIKADYNEKTTGWRNGLESICRSLAGQKVGLEKKPTKGVHKGNIAVIFKDHAFSVPLDAVEVPFVKVTNDPVPAK
ncbi:MAG: hypothetical protein R3E13_01640 [Alphaproteobacteria bacterium]